jgi:AcrR family transcriptional regulator
MVRASAKGRRREEPGELSVRQRILDAATAAFMEHGFAATSTLEIATRAQVSKRDLYALVGTKQEMLAASIGERAARFRVPVGVPVPHHRDSLADALTAFGTQLLREVSDPTVIGVFRLAIAEATRAPEVARALDSIGRSASRAALRGLIAQAQLNRLIDGNPNDMAEQFAGLLWGNLLVGLILGVAERPGPREIARRARDATTAFLRIYPQPNSVRSV